MEQYIVIYLANGRLVDSEVFLNSPDAFTEAEYRVDGVEGNGITDAIVYELVEDRLIHVRSY